MGGSGTIRPRVDPLRSSELMRERAGAGGRGRAFRGVDMEIDTPSRGRLWLCAVFPRWAASNEGSNSLEREARVTRRGSRSREGARQRGWCEDVCVSMGEATLAVRDRDGACGRPLGKRVN